MVVEVHVSVHIALVVVRVWQVVQPLLCILEPSCLCQSYPRVVQESPEIKISVASFVSSFQQHHQPLYIKQGASRTLALLEYYGHHTEHVLPLWA